MIAMLIHWWRCPRKVVAAAADYERSHLAPGGREWLFSHSLAETQRCEFIDLTRIVGYRYGLLRQVIRSAEEVWQAGWNRQLISDAGGDARRAAIAILERVQTMVRAGVAAKSD